MKRILQMNEEEWECWRGFEETVEGLEDRQNGSEQGQAEEFRSSINSLETTNGINPLTQMYGLNLVKNLWQFPK